jgi:hypothetical protein
MNDSQRAELFAQLSELSRQYPQWRLGQLVANVADWVDQSLWDVEDDQLLAAVQRHLREKHAERVGA